MLRFFTLATLASAILAQPIHHAHKREAAPVDEYVTVHYTKYVTANAAAAAQVNSAAAPLYTASVDINVAAANAYSAPPPQVNSAAPTPAPAPAPVETSSPAPAPLQASSSSSVAAPAPAASGSTSVSGQGIAYSPYSANGGCKSADEVKSDLSKLTEYSLIRLYGVDCDQVSNVLAALAPNQQVFLGVFDIGSVPQDLATLKAAVEGSSRGWDVVHTVSIGNEWVNSGTASVDQVGQLTSQGRGILRGYGYQGPVVSVDTFIAIINNPQLCQYSDYAAANAHAFFDTDTTAAQAGDWALLQIQRVWSACGGSKSVMITESGWPSAGQTNGAAVPSPENQQTAISSLKSKVGNDVILFTAFNDLWKAPGYLGVEQSFGIYGTDNN